MLDIFVSTAQKEIATRYNGKRDVVGRIYNTDEGLCIQCICGERHEHQEHNAATILPSDKPYLGYFRSITEIRELVKYNRGHLRRIEPEQEHDEN